MPAEHGTGDGGSALSPDAVVLVEGVSDQRAVERLASRTGCDLVSAAVAVVEIGGATNVWRYLERYRTRHPHVRLAGLCDANQEHAFRRALAQFGFGADLSRDEMEAAGFFVCDADLEDELIRSLGVERVLEIIEAEGELPAFRTYQKQPAHAARALEQQVHGFMWNRKLRYATLLVDALDLDRVPRPLAGVSRSPRRLRRFDAVPRVRVRRVNIWDDDGIFFIGDLGAEPPS